MLNVKKVLAGRSIVEPICRKNIKSLLSILAINLLSGSHSPGVLRE